jgi:uncharacterized protein
MDQPLDTISVRVLGSLVEKEFTTPDNYPLTLNALTAACNQTSNRDPIMALDESSVAATLVELSKRSLVREVYRSDSRAKRWRHTMVETLSLHAEELAILCVLMLRGAQTTGEIRTRTSRMVPFRDLAHVDVTVQSLMTLSTPLVMQLPRRPGQKEVRYVHLLSGQPDPDDIAFAAPPRTPTTSQHALSEAGGDRVAAVEDDVARMRDEFTAMRDELAALRAEFDEFRRQFQ